MTHKLILKVKKFQLSGAIRFGTVEGKPPGGGGGGGGVDSTPYHLGLKMYEKCLPKFTEVMCCHTVLFTVIEVVLPLK